MIASDIKENIYKLLDLYSSRGINISIAMTEISKLFVVVLMNEYDEQMFFKKNYAENHKKEMIQYGINAKNYKNICTDISRNEDNLVLKHVFSQGLENILVDRIEESYYMINRIIASSGYSTKANYKKIAEIYEMICSISIENINVGVFVTPRYLISIMSKLINPNSDDEIYDFACGTGGFLIGMNKYSNSKYVNITQKYYGNDINKNLLFYTKLNNFFHDKIDVTISDTDIFIEDTLDKKFDVVISNPPVGVKINRHFNSKSTKSEIASALYSIELVKNGGKVSILIPDSILSNSSKEFVDFRTRLLDVSDKLGIISLPAGIFDPYTSSKASILVFSKNDIDIDVKNKKIFMAIIPDEIKKLDRTDYAYVSEEIDILISEYLEFFDGSLKESERDNIEITTRLEVVNNSDLLPKTYIKMRKKSVENIDLSETIIQLIEKEKSIIKGLENFLMEIELYE